MRFFQERNYFIDREKSAALKCAVLYHNTTGKEWTWRVFSDKVECVINDTVIIFSITYTALTADTFEVYYRAAESMRKEYRF